MLQLMTSDLDHLHDYFLSLGFAAQPSTYRKAATVTSTQRAYRTPPFPAEAHSRRPASGCPPTEGAFGPLDAVLGPKDTEMTKVKPQLSRSWQPVRGLRS